MGIRQDVKAGLISSKLALSTLELTADLIQPSIEGWLKRRIARGADKEEEAARQKAAEKRAEPKKKRRNKKHQHRR